MLWYGYPFLVQRRSLCLGVKAEMPTSTYAGHEGKGKERTDPTRKASMRICINEAKALINISLAYYIIS